MKESTSVGTTLPQLSATGKYLTDPDGNVVILRGYNLCTKTAQTPEQLGFDIRNAKLLKECGVSVVRLGLPWVNVQPYLAYDDNGSWQYDMQFLASIKRTIQLLAEFGIYTLVDFHQDGYSAPWGFGAPSWAMIAGGTNTPNAGWPINTFGATTATFQIKGTPTTIETDLNSAFDFFWNDSPIPTIPINASAPLDGAIIDIGNGLTLWKAYGEMLQFVSTYLSDQQGNILGYDPINEPEPGSQWTEGYVAPSDPINLFNFPKGFPEFDVNYLAAFYQKCVFPALRAGHPEAMIWFEPNIYFDYNAPTLLPDLSAFGNVGFNFHNYDAAVWQCGAAVWQCGATVWQRGAAVWQCSAAVWQRGAAGAHARTRGGAMQHDKCARVPAFSSCQPVALPDC
jgi:endoglycosylceramidase